MRCTVWSKRSRFSQRFISMVSAPNISGTSVSTDVPPCAMRKSENSPSRGLAVMPENPSDPPHLRPTRNSERGISVRTSWLARLYISRSRFMPSAISSSLFCATINLMRLSSYSPTNSRNTSGWLFSHPSPTTSTPPALGCSTISRSIFFVFSWSSPSCEQP